MAKRIEKPAAKHTDVGADDLDILFPDRELMIAGKKITVREYGFVEGLRIRAAAKPFIEDLAGVMKATGVPLVEQITGLIEKHAELVIVLIAESADVDQAFMRALSDSEGEALMGCWWSVNGPFFLNKAKDRLRAEVVDNQLRKSLVAGQTSLPNSSPTTTTPTESEITPSDS